MNIKELVVTNPFFAHAEEILEIGKTHNVDVGVAADMARDKYFPSEEPMGENYKQFTKLCRERTLISIVEELNE